MKIRTLMVDDEKPARDALRRMLAELPVIDLVGEAANAPEALDLIRARQPELLLLDVEMPEMTGVQMLGQLESPPLVIFVSAYPQYAVEAFEYNALHYVLKPVRPERLAEAVARAAKELRTPPSYDAVTKAAPPPERIAVWHVNGHVLLHRHIIHCALLEEGRVRLSTEKGPYTYGGSLTQLALLLPTFIRVSRTALVNLESVEVSHPGVAPGTLILRLKNGTLVDVSRDNTPEVRRLLGV